MALTLLRLLVACVSHVCACLLHQVIAQIWVLLLSGLGLAYGLDVWAGHETPTILGLAAFGSLISYIYSAPPLKVRPSGRPP